MNSSLKSLGRTETILFAVTAALMFSVVLLVLIAGLGIGQTTTSDSSNTLPTDQISQISPESTSLPAVTIVAKRLTAKQKIALDNQAPSLPVITIIGHRTTYLPTVLPAVVVVAKRLNPAQKTALAKATSGATDSATDGPKYLL